MHNILPIRMKIDFTKISKKKLKAFCFHPTTGCATAAIISHHSKFSTNLRKPMAAYAGQ